jgi:putative heme-binding domain-containing protein
MIKLELSHLRRFTTLLVAIALPSLVSILASGGFAALKPRDPSSIRFERGRRLFYESGCSHCHSIDGAGQRRYGPALHEIGKLAADRKPGMTAPQYILESILDPGAFRAPGANGGMPEGAFRRDKDDLRQLVGFLASRGASVRVEEIERLNIPDVPQVRVSGKDFDLSKAKQGETIFRGKGECITCHVLRPDPASNLLAPSLLSVGSLNAKDLRESIVDPNAKISPGYEQVVARKRDGLTVSGRLLEKSDDGIYVLEKRPAGDLATVFVPFSEIQPSEDDEAPDYWVSKASLMPIVKDALTAEEIDALVAFLKNRHGNR